MIKLLFLRERHRFWNVRILDMFLAPIDMVYDYFTGPTLILIAKF